MRPANPIFSEQATLDELFKRYAQGENLSSLGRAFGTDHSTIYYHLKKHGKHISGRKYIPVRKGSIVAKDQQERTDAQDKVWKDILQDYQEGTSLNILTVRYKLSASKIRDYLKRVGIYNPDRTYIKNEKLKKPLTYNEYLKRAAVQTQKKYGRNYSYISGGHRFAIKSEKKSKEPLDPFSPGNTFPENEDHLGE